MPAKTKARDLVKNWPRGKSTSGPFEGVRFLGRPFVPGAQYYRYVPLTAFNAGLMGAEEVTPEFRYTTEYALESEYRAGQQKMLDDYRARYRTLTEEDKNWLRCADGNPLREAIKSQFYQHFVDSLATGHPLPLDMLSAIKQSFESDTEFWYRYRRARI